MGIYRFRVISSSFAVGGHRCRSRSTANAQQRCRAASAARETMLNNEAVMSCDVPQATNKQTLPSKPGSQYLKLNRARLLTGKTGALIAALSIRGCLMVIGDDGNKEGAVNLVAWLL